MPIEHRPPHLSYVLKRPSINSCKSLSTDQAPPTSPLARREPSTSQPVSPITRQPTSKIEQQSNLTIKTEQLVSPSPSSGNAFTKWFNGLTPTQKLIFKGTIATVAILSVITAIVVPVGITFGTTQTSSQTTSSTTSSTVSICSSSTAIGHETPYRSSITTVLYPFDGNMLDLIINNIGTPFGISLPSAVNQGYINQGLLLGSNSQQYVVIPSLNFSQSFTLQVWIYPNTMSLTAEMAVFSQCDSNSICLTLLIRNARFAFSFDSMNSNSFLLGTTLLNSNGVWVHVTVVYDATLRQQQLYVNGRIDAVSGGSVDLYRGTIQGSIASVGRHPNITSGFVFFDGRIDHLMISLGVVRSAYQILNDATLTAYYPFDNVGTNNDYNVHMCNGIMAGTTVVSTGRVNQALSYSTTNSYFQSQCYASQRLLDQAYTVSLWIRPTITTNGGSLVHLSSLTNGNGTCFDLLVFTNAGALVAQHMTQWGNVIAIQGPLIPVNVWTHVAVIYGSTYGLRLYINGQLAVTTSMMSSLSIWTTSMTPLFITLGNISPLGSAVPIVCSNGSIAIAPGSYNGLIDDFRLYNRELNTQDLCNLVNP